MSAQIMDMEAKLERKLVERRHGKIVLTEAGQRILPPIRRILRDVQSLEEMLSQDRGLLIGPLRIGMIPTVAPYLLPHLIPHLQAHYPKLDMKVREAITDTLGGRVAGRRTGRQSSPPNRSTSRTCTPSICFRDRFYIASATGGSDVLHSPLSEDQVALDRLMLLDEGHCLRDQALAVCAKGTERRLVNLGATSMTTLLQMVANGMGLTLLPEIALPSRDGDQRGLTITPFARRRPAPRHRAVLAQILEAPARFRRAGAIAQDRVRANLAAKRRPLEPIRRHDTHTASHDPHRDRRPTKPRMNSRRRSMTLLLVTCARTHGATREATKAQARTTATQSPRRPDGTPGRR
jgi:LysR family hydrogen peroxide-inducible transcriptional activator